VVQSRSVVFRLVVQIRTRNLAVTGSTLTRSTASNLKHVARQGNARQRCVMGMCLYAHLVQTKNKQCRSTIILQCYHPYLSDFCSRPRLTPQPHNLLCGQENSASYPPLRKMSKSLPVVSHLLIVPCNSPLQCSPSVLVHSSCALLQLQNRISQTVQICVHISHDNLYFELNCCADMDECEHDGMCPNGVCINVDGSYICRCNPGFRQSPNQQICIGVSVCLIIFLTVCCK